MRERDVRSREMVVRCCILMDALLGDTDCVLSLEGKKNCEVGLGLLYTEGIKRYDKLVQRSTLKAWMLLGRKFH